MKIVSIEPTPSPHSMKINVNEMLADGSYFQYKRTDDLTNAPDYAKNLLQIDGIISIYRVVDFITIARNPKTAWEAILPAVQETLGVTKDAVIDQQPTNIIEENDNAFGEVRVFLQMFRQIPMQIKLEDGETEKRVGLPPAFADAVLRATTPTTNIIFERKWVEQSVRYGTLDEIGIEVLEELKASYDEERLEQLVEHALAEKDVVEEKQQVTLKTLEDPDWRVRYAALDRLGDPTLADIPVLNKALDDTKSSIRRLATAYLGMIEEKEVLPYLYKALKDKAANVRRTAGDCLSDLGFPEAMPEMIETLKDENRIVRWRAAMYLYEVGDESAVPALEEAINDPEFEVRLQIRMALERIKGGEAAKGSIWSQMLGATKSKE